MREIVSCERMKALDAETITKKQVPALVLMERAALEVVKKLEEKPETLKRVLIVCGMGNNGGDGIAIGRLLHLKGYQADLFLLGKKERMTEETKTQYAIAANYQVSFVNNPRWQEYTTIVDAVFGVGLTRDVAGEFARVIGEMNAAAARKLAVDLPSGIQGDTGQVLHVAFQAQETVTFAYGKPGLFLYPGCCYAGDVTVADIGIYAMDNKPPQMAAFTWEDLKRALPARDPSGNKGTFGKALILASQKNMAGAGYLSAKSCFTMGAGMVKIHTQEDNRTVYQSILPEAMVTCQKTSGVDLQLLEEDLSWCTVAGAGPGLGTEEDSRRLLEYLLTHCKKSMVLDADALNLLSLYPQLQSYLGPHCILTPHLGEMSRLTGRTIEEIQRAPRTVLQEFQARTGAVCVMKDARTWTCPGDGTLYLNVSGNDGMATAGAGDVLAGMLTGLLAIGMEPLKAAPLGVYLHGLAGDEARKRKGARAMTATDMIAGAARVLKRIED
ncbi:MAG: NAD(P)H-hydrate dehydratase [Blautia sp.]